MIHGHFAKFASHSPPSFLPSKALTWTDADEETERGEGDPGKVNLVAKDGEGGGVVLVF